MNNTMPIRLLLSVLLLIPGLAAPAHAEQPAGIHVSGRGTLEVVPDMGRVELHVRREGTQAGALKTELDKVVAAVLALTRKLDIRETDVTATALSITPRYQRRGDESVVEGLVASRSIAVTLRDLDAFGDLLNGALALGVNNADPMRLDTSLRATLEDEALALAMEDAKSEAGKVAAGFSVQLGPVSNVQLGSHSPRPEMMRAVVMADTATSFSPGVITIERMLNVTFSIIPGK